MKTRILVPFLTLLLAGSLFGAPTWYQPSGWSLGTELPASPQDVSEHKTAVPGGEIVESRVGVQQNDEIFVVVMVRLPAPIPTDGLDAAYDAGLASMQRGSSEVVMSEEKMIIGGHIGRRWMLHSKDGLRVTDHRTVIIGDVAFEFMYERPVEQTPSSAAETFFSKIAPRKADQTPAATPGKETLS